MTYEGSFTEQTSIGMPTAFSCAIATFSAVQEGHYIRTGQEIK